MTKISIITPIYNSEQFISETIRSVINQTYQDWEMIIIDDCSTDNSFDIIKKIIKNNDKIKYLMTNCPSGSPAHPRNIGIENASGRYIAFLDSDDLWLPNKLYEQVALFENDEVAIVFSNYEKINEEGKRSARIVNASHNVDYKKLLNGNIIACSTAIYDTRKVGKMYFNKQGHEDYAFWLSILRKGYIAKNSCTITTLYRVRKSSISSDKKKIIKWLWIIYRKNEGLSLFNSFYHLIITIIKSIIKYFK